MPHVSLLRKAHLRAFKISMSSNQSRNHNRLSTRLKFQPSQLLLQVLLNLSLKVLPQLILKLLLLLVVYLLFKRELEHKCLFLSLKENKIDLKCSSSKERNTCNLEECLFTTARQLFLLQLFLMFLLVLYLKEEEILWLAMKLTKIIMLLSMLFEISHYKRRSSLWNFKAKSLSFIFSINYFS